MGGEPVSTKRLVEIMAANFIAAAFVASPIGFLAWLSQGGGMSIETLGIFFILWPFSWGVFSVGRAWQRNRDDVYFPAPLRQVLDRLGINGEAEEFMDLLYLPGVQIPTCTTSQPVIPKFLR